MRGRKRHRKKAAKKRAAASRIRTMALGFVFDTRPFNDAFRSALVYIEALRMYAESERFRRNLERVAAIMNEPAERLDRIRADLLENTGAKAPQ